MPGLTSQQATLKQATLNTGHMNQHKWKGAVGLAMVKSVVPGTGSGSPRRPHDVRLRPSISMLPHTHAFTYNQIARTSICTDRMHDAHLQSISKLALRDQLVGNL
eukprot:675712-Pelagomonas_calceolata.AAC.1